MSAHDDLGRYLSRKHPDAATELQVLRGDDLIARYRADDLSARPLGDVAREIVDSCESDADGQGFQCRYVARWCDSQGQVLQAPHSWRAGTGSVQPLDGGAISLVAQTQRHLEAMMRQHVASVAQVLQQASNMSMIAVDRLLASERRLAIVEADNAALRAQLREAEGSEPTDAGPTALETAAIQIATAFAASRGVPIDGVAAAAADPVASL
jgi:hypothetical protein